MFNARLLRRALFCALATLLAFSLTTRAQAQAVPSTGPGSDTPLPEPPIPEPEVAPTGVSAPDMLIDRRMRRSWNEGDTRGFAATTLDVGWTYLRPRLSLGYGKPFGTWVGIDLNPIVAGAGLGAYGGLRFSLPRVDLRVGPRYFFSFNREYLVPQRNFNEQDLDATTGSQAKVLTLEAELEASVPAGPGDIVGLGSLSYVTNVPNNMYVFEETLHVIVAPPLVWRARGGYVFRFGSARQHSIGVVADFLDVPKRDDSRTIRIGPIVRIVLSRRVEVRGSFVPTIVSPDHIGLTGGDFTELGFRYRWATE